MNPLDLVNLLAGNNQVYCLTFYPNHDPCYLRVEGVSEKVVEVIWSKYWGYDVDKEAYQSTEDAMAAITRRIS